MSSLNNFFELLKVISSILFSLFGVLIAFLVYELNRQKFRLDLLSKRNEGFDHFKSCISIYSRYGCFIDKANDKDYVDEAMQHAHAFKSYSIFFDDNVDKLAKDLISWVADYSYADNLSKDRQLPDNERKKILRDLQSLDQYYSNLVKRASESVTPFLKIDEPKKLSLILKSLFTINRGNK